VSLGPADADAYVALALVLTSAGTIAEAVAAVDTAFRLNPKLPPSDLQVAGLAYLLNGDASRAVRALETARGIAPKDVDSRVLLAAAYAGDNRLDDARSEVAAILHQFPDTSVQYERVIYGHFRRDHDLARLLDALRRAGLPDWPYGYRGDAENALGGAEITSLAFGRTWQGQLEGGQPALLNIGRDGKTAFRTPTIIVTGVAFVDRDMLCERSESIWLGRNRCGRLYRGPSDPLKKDNDTYTYVAPDKVFHFSVTE
jgi:tetratricopeptide (TPR) repeat protein